MSPQTMGRSNLFFLSVKLRENCPFLHPYLIGLIKLYCIGMQTQVSHANMERKVAINTATAYPWQFFQQFSP